MAKNEAHSILMAVIYQYHNFSGLWALYVPMGQNYSESILKILLKMQTSQDTTNMACAEAESRELEGQIKTYGEN